MHSLRSFFVIISLVLIGINLGCMEKWSKVYRGDGSDVVKSIEQTSDGGYILAASTESFGESHYMVMKIDLRGNFEWQRSIDMHCSSSYGLQQTTDGGFIVAGEVSHDIAVVKFDWNGDPVWKKVYDLGDLAHAGSIHQTSDGGYIVAGATYKSLSSPGSKYDLWVLKLNSAGVVDWEKSYGGNNNDLATLAHQTSDGGYIVVGKTWSFGAGLFDYWVLKLDSTGNISWQKTYGDSHHNHPQSIQQTVDGGYIVAGFTEGPMAHAWVLKLDVSGNVEWQKIYDLVGFTRIRSIQQTTDGGYIMAGHGIGHIWVVKLNGSGAVSWEKTYGGDGTDVAYSVQQTSDGGYIVAGYTLSFGSLSYDMWVLKLDSAGDIDDCDIVGTTTTNVSNTAVVGQPSNAAVMSTNATVTDIQPRITSAEIITICE